MSLISLLTLVGMTAAQTAPPTNVTRKANAPTSGAPIVRTSLTRSPDPLPDYAPPTYYPNVPDSTQSPSPISPQEIYPGEVVGALRLPDLFEAEYLLWWVKDSGQLPNGLVGVVPVSDYFNSSNGRLENITPLTGSGSYFDFGVRSGLRLGLTHYFDEEQGNGFDISWTNFFKSDINERYRSVDGYMLGPTFTDIDGTRSLVLASFPALMEGIPTGYGRAASVNVNSASRLWGAEANWRIRLPVAFFCDRVWLLAGARTLQFGEGFGVETLSRPLPGSAAMSTVELRDSFTALNQYFGPQVGLQTRTQIGSFSLDLTGKTSWGGQYEQIKIAGDTVISSPAGLQRLQGGVLAQASNIGTVDSTRMAWVNELSVKGGWNFCDTIRATVGYSLLHSNRMVRVVNAVDAVDSRSIQVLESFDPTANATRPLPPTLAESYWWAQGLTFGVDLSF